MIDRVCNRLRAGAVFPLTLLTLLPCPALGLSDDRCTRALLAAEQAEDLPPGLLLAAALARRFGAAAPSGPLSPWTWSARAGDKVTVTVAETAQAALAGAEPVLRRASAEPRLGCALLLWTGHRRYLKAPIAAIDPASSARYFARYLKRTKAREASWTAAVAAAWSEHGWRREIHTCEVAHQYARLLGQAAPKCRLD